MQLDKIVQQLNLMVLTQSGDLTDIQVGNGYCSDLLSCVMTGAQTGDLWITLMAHSNIVAVAALLDLSAIIITENAQPDETTIHKANDNGVILLSTQETNFQTIGKLWELGLRAE
jgi:hypothetical protein